MFAIAVTEPGKLQMVDIPAPTPGPYEARIRTEAACLCNATDRKLIEGHFPGVEDYPLLLGHETVGIVDTVGEKVRNFKVGDRVVGALLLNTTDPAYASGWGAGDHHAMMEDGVAIPDQGWAEVFEIMRVVPKSIPIEAAVMLCTWREVYAAFGDFNLQPGDDIVVFGAGPVGLSFVKFARLLGLNEIYSVEFLLSKRQKALQMGATGAFAPSDADLLTLVEQRQKPFDAVIDAVGRADILNAALPMIKLGGSVCVYGVVDTPVIPLEKHRGPYNFNLLVHQWPTRFRESAAQEPLIQWIESGQINHQEFISAEFPIQDIANAFEVSKVGETIKILFRF
jgi:threonine dehydrogenase-like Zn-dependent dehydrogenase